ncbi:MAG: DUF5654 family protein [Candidatus Pacearchaeota archaeon]
MVEEQKQEEKSHAREMRGKIITQIATLLTAAFGFVAALQWNNWVQAVMKPITEKGGSSNFWLLLVAVLVTIIAVLVAYFLGRASAKVK